MRTRSLLLLIGYLRGGQMFPTAVPIKGAPTARTLSFVLEELAAQERALFGSTSSPVDRPDVEGLPDRAAITSWSGAPVALETRVADVPDPGVLLCLLYDVPVQNAPLPVEVFAQTLRRYAMRNAGLKATFDEHMDEAGSFTPSWMSPAELRQKSEEAFDAAMAVARGSGFAHAVPLFEAVRGDSFPAAQVAIAVYEVRELGDAANALRRLSEVVRVAPRNVAARMQRAKLLMRDPSRLVEAASDFLAVLRELARQDTLQASAEVRDEATQGLWVLHREFADPPKLEAALALAAQDEERGFEALSRYVHTHPCAWDAQAHLGTLALARQRFDVATKLLGNVRWLFPDDPAPHFVYGQALASQGRMAAAVEALEHAAALSPGDADIAGWLAFARKRAKIERDAGVSSRLPSVRVARHVARTLLVLLGIVRAGRVVPAALQLPSLPGDMSLGVVLQEIAAREPHVLGELTLPPSRQQELPSVADRCALSDHAGLPLKETMRVSEVPDPGIVVAILYSPVRRDEAGRAMLDPPPAQCRATLFYAVEQDREIGAELDRHLASTEATLMSRLEGPLA